MNWLWRIFYRFNRLRSRRAQAAAALFERRAEKFFQRIKGARS